MKWTISLVLAVLMTSLALHAVEARSLPSQYTAKYGEGAQGVSLISGILTNPKTTETEKKEALKALTFYGDSAVQALLEYADRVKEAKGDQLSVAQSLSKVLDRRLLPKLLELSKSTEIKVQEAALLGLAGYLLHTPITVTRRSESGSAVSTTYSGASTLTPIYSRGSSRLTKVDQDLIAQVAIDIKESDKSTTRVQWAAGVVLSVIGERNTKTQDSANNR